MTYSTKVTKMHNRATLIRGLLLQRGYTLDQAAKALRVTRSAISQVLSGRGRSLRIEGWIAQRVSMPWASIFPPLKKNSPKRHKREIPSFRKVIVRLYENGRAA